MLRTPLQIVNRKIFHLKIYALGLYFIDVFHMLFILIWFYQNNISIALIFAYNLVVVAISFMFNNLFSKLSDKKKNRFVFLFLSNIFVSIGLIIIIIEISFLRLLLFAFLLNAISGESFIIAFFYDLIEKRDELKQNEDVNFKEKKAREFTKFRIFGSIGWAIGAPVAGFMISLINIILNSDVLGFQIVFLFSAIGYIFINLYFLAFLRQSKVLLQFTGDDVSKPIPNNTSKEKAKISILKNPEFLILLMIMALFQIGGALSYSIKTIYATELGGSLIFVGFLAFTWALCEVPLFFLSSKMVEKYSYNLPILISGLFLITKFIFYIFIITPDTLFLFLALEVLNHFGISWPALTYAINQRFAKENKAFGTSIYVTIMAIARFIGNLLGMILAISYNIGGVGGSYEDYKILFIFGLIIVSIAFILFFTFSLISQNRYVKQNL